MASISRHIHMQANFVLKPLREMAPDLGLQVQPTNGDQPSEPIGLAFVDPDGETHIYVFDEAGKQHFIRVLTGGVVIAQPGQI